MTWPMAAAVCIPIVAVCAMVVLCVRYIARTPDDPRPAQLGRTLTRGRGHEDTAPLAVAVPEDS